MYDDHLRDFKNTFYNLASRYGKASVFRDFVKMCSISIYNAFAKNEELEKDYLNTINTYNKEDINKFPKMFSSLIAMYEESPQIKDILGEFYSLEKLGNSRLGQFFTPQHISELMAKCTIGKKEDIDKIIKEKGYITMCEPTCGAGGMVLSFAKTLKEYNINYQQNLLVEAIDISDVCTYMTYIQLSLYGIPAIVYCGDTISQKMHFKLQTPLFFLQYWRFRNYQTKNDLETENETEKIIIDKSVIELEKFKEKSIKGNYQISLW